MICVVTLVDRSKGYCLGLLLAHLAALEPPDGETLRYLVMVAGDLTPAQDQIISQFERERAGSVETCRGPALRRREDSGYGYSLRAAEFRERARRALARRRDRAVFWVDCDVLNPPDTLQRLWPLLHGAIAVSGLVLDRRNGSPMAFRFPLGVLAVEPGIQEVDWTGMGCFLADGALSRAISFEPFLRGEREAAYGEDGHWCLEAHRRTGWRVLLDADVQPWHVDSTGVAVQAVFREDGTMARRLKTVPVTTPAPEVAADRVPAGQMALVPSIDGYSHRFGRLEAGRPFWCDATGRALTEEEMREAAAASQYLELVEPAG